MSSLSNPGTIEHQISDWRFRLDQDGSLQACASDGNGGSLQLTPEIAFALAVFFRMPGARALLNRCELERQHTRHMMEVV